ncbi:MAG TPA: DUF6798 domain-containing protein [Tepidisphaeraceae bacterium]|nr:DUF6798 domain-containing protein [Tepidisphaeraceae bacterium]
MEGATVDDAAHEIPSRFDTALALCLATAITLATRGYQFASPDHAIYLVAPLRQAFPGLLDHDWWATHTLQYHVAFTTLAACLLRWGVAEPAFAVAQVGLMLALHAAWLRLARAVGLSTRAYLLSVVLYYLSAGGVGLGAYRFDQEASLFPANVANVAMLWGLVLWIDGRSLGSAFALGVAGLFHLNHAIVAGTFWFIVGACASFRSIHAGSCGVGFAAQPRVSRVSRYRAWILGGLLIALLSAPNLLPALRTILAGHAKLPLAEFVDLYVRTRHPHHYDPLSWPIALWASFLWSVLVAAAAPFALSKSQNKPGHSTRALPEAPPRMRPTGNDQSDCLGARSRTARVFTFFLLILLLAFTLAGVTFVSEPLVQMSLFRFSIYPKLIASVVVAGLLLSLPARTIRSTLALAAIAIVLGIACVLLGALGATVHTFATHNAIPLCVVTALLVTALAGVAFTAPPATPTAANVPAPSQAHGFIRGRPANARTYARATILTILTACTLLTARNDFRGLHLDVPTHADPAYLALCHWARDHTDKNAIFLVPPAEQAMRFHGRRAIVINLKGVPQLSAELGEWRNRLEAVLATKLTALPRRFDLAHAALVRRYDELSADHLAAVARRYSARYIVVGATSAARDGPTGATRAYENAGYRVYDLGDR